MEDDDIIVSQSVVTTLFRRFVGRAPNYFNSKTVQTDRYTFHEGYAKGIPLNDVTIPSPSSSGSAESHKHCFTAPSALEWLCSFIALAGKDEAAEIAAHFVRFGFLVLVCDKQKDAEHITYTVRGPVQEGASIVSVRPLSLSLPPSHPRLIDFFSVKENSDVHLKRFTKSLQKGCELQIGHVPPLLLPLLPPLFLLPSKPPAVVRERNTQRKAT